MVLIALATPGAAAGTGPTITRFSPSSGPLGTLVTIYGSGLGTARDVKFNGFAASIVSRNADQVKATVPVGASTGPITVRTRGGTATSPTAFTVTPGIILVHQYVQPGGKAVVSGSGFAPRSKINIYLDRKLRKSVTTNLRGTFTDVGIGVPLSAQPGQHPITAQDVATGGSVSYSLLVFVNWPQFRNDPTHKGRNDLEHGISKANVNSLAVSWTGATDGAVFSSPAVADGVVYVGSMDGKLYAFPAFGCGGPTCTPLWTGATGGAIHSSPQVANGVVYIGSDDGRLYAFSANGCGASTCSKLWSSKQTNGAIESSPVVVNGRVYVGSMDHKLYAYNSAGCGILQFVCGPLWYSTNIGALFSSPTVASGVVYVGSEQRGGLYAFQASGCSSPPCAPLASGYGQVQGIDSSPAVANGIVYAGAGDIFRAFITVSCGNATCISTCGTEAHQEGFEFRSSPAIANGVVYIGNEDGALYTLAAGSPEDPDSCEPGWWSTATGGKLFSSPAVANGVVYVGSQDARLYAFAAGGCASSPCAPMWSSGPTGGAIDSSPAVANGVVYVGSNDGKLYAFTLNGQ